MEVLADFYNRHRWLIVWSVVVFGAFSVFSYSVLLEFPQHVRQAVGVQILTYCTQDAVFRVAFAIFLARAATLVIYDPLFGLSRLLIIQFPWSVSRILPTKAKRWSRRYIVKARRLLDAVLLIWVGRPVLISSIFAFCIFFFTLEGEFRFLIAIVFILAIVIVGGYQAENLFEEKWKVRFVYSNRRVDLSEIKAMGVSTAILLCAWLIGNAEGRALERNAPEVKLSGEKQRLVFVDSNLFVTLRTVEGEDIWVLNVIQNIGEITD